MGGFLANLADCRRQRAVLQVGVALGRARVLVAQDGPDREQVDLGVDPLAGRAVVQVVQVHVVHVDGMARAAGAIQGALGNREGQPGEWAF